MAATRSATGAATSHSESVSPVGERRRRGGDRTAERILDVAERLFAERGYAGTTLRDVASAVGVRNPSIYNHFDSKESLYEAVLERGLGPVLDTLGEFVARGADAYGNSRLIVERIMKLLAGHPHLPKLILHETLAGGQRLSPMLSEWIVPTFAHAYEMASSSPAAKRWGPDRVPLLVMAMYHIIVGYFTVAPLFNELGGNDLMTEEALEKQTDFLCDVIEALFEQPAEEPLS